MPKLTARQVATAKGPKRLGDGDGLWLEISATGRKRWLVRYFPSPGRPTEKAIGNATYVTLADARIAAHDFKRNLALGIAPTKRVTFGEVAADVLEAKSPSLKLTTARQWKRWLRYCDTLTDRDISTLTVDDCLAVLRPLWTTKSASADRVRALLEMVFSAAKVRGLRTGDNPATWRGNLDQLLAKRPTLVNGHHAALPYAEAPALFQRLESEGVVGRAMQFLMLTALRKMEALGARWSEIDRDLLNVPATRMKMKKAFTVPLSAPALAILEHQRQVATGDHVFPSPFSDRPLSTGALNNMLIRLGVGGTIHGFRSMFRDWCGDCTDAPREVAEAALAHTVTGVEGSYRRGDALEKRKVLMQRWGRFLTERTLANIGAQARTLN